MHATDRKRSREEQENQFCYRKKIFREEDLTCSIQKRIIINGAFPRDIYQVSTATLKDLYTRTNRDGNFAYHAIVEILKSCTLAFDPTTPIERATSVLQPVCDALYKIDMSNASEDDSVEFLCIENILKIALKVLDLKYLGDTTALSEMKGQILPMFT